MLNQSGLDLRRGESVPGDVDDIIHTAPDPVVAIMIRAGAVASELQQVRRRTTMKTQAHLYNNPYIR